MVTSCTVCRVGVERLGHRPGLDRVRGIAVLLVIASHLHMPGFTHGGGSGVTLFFALSGFLITSLVVEEWQSTGTIRLRSFYVRRARRLVPALVALVVVVVAYETVRGNRGVVAHAAMSLGYVTNWVRALGAGGGTRGATNGADVVGGVDEPVTGC